MGWAQIRGKAFVEEMKRRGHDFAGREQEVERQAAGIMQMVHKAQDTESKKATLCYILMRKLREGAYGDQTQEPIKTILSDLKSCFDPAEYSRHTAEELWTMANGA